MTPQRLTLTVCAAGSGVSAYGLPPVLVCGKPPGHEPPHRDAVWPVEWDDPNMAESCAKSRRPDADHAWEFDGDDPYIRCRFCVEVRDALTGGVVTAGARPQPGGAR